MNDRYNELSIIRQGLIDGLITSLADRPGISYAETVSQHADMVPDIMEKVISDLEDKDNE